MDIAVDRFRTVIQWSEADNAYICAIPALPGCRADGPTRPEALKNLDRVAELWITEARSMGRAIPAPECY